jgi:hypothetical protein
MIPGIQIGGPVGTHSWADLYKKMETDELLLLLSRGLNPDADAAARQELTSRGASHTALPSILDDDKVPDMSSRAFRIVAGVVFTLLGSSFGKFIGEVVVYFFLPRTPLESGLAAVRASIVTIFVLALSWPGVRLAVRRYPYEKIPGFTKLMYCASKDSVSGMRQRQAAGDQIDAIDSKGGTALIYAARNGYMKAVRWLLRSGANASLTLPNGDNAAAIAEKYGHSDVARFIRSGEE